MYNINDKKYNNMMYETTKSAGVKATPPRTNLEVMYSSKNPDWETPIDLFDKLNFKYKFDVDVCADDDNNKCAYYYTKENDGLTKDWKGVCWMNPPYGRDISKWVKKASEEALKGATVVALLPARTDTKWFHNFIYKKHNIKFIKGRLKFVGAKSSAPFPSMLVEFKEKNIIDKLITKYVK